MNIIHTVYDRKREREEKAKIVNKHKNENKNKMPCNIIYENSTRCAILIKMKFKLFYFPFCENMIYKYIQVNM